MLFADQRHHKLSIPARDNNGSPVTIAHLIDHLCQHVMKDNRKQLFVLDNHMYVQLTPPLLQPENKRGDEKQALPPPPSPLVILPHSSPP